MRFKNVLNRAGSFGLAVLTALTICPTNFTQAAEPESEVMETSVTSSAMVYINGSEYGETTVDDTEEPTEVLSGETVKIKASAHEGYQVSAITAASADGLETFEVYAVDDHYEFVMPETDVYVTTWYETASEGEEEPSSEEETSVEETTTEEASVIPEEDTTEASSETETETQAEIVDIYASDFDFSSVDGIDFSSGRLIVAGDDSIFIDRSVIVSSYDGMYILQFTDIETAKRAYGYYSDKAAMVIVDTPIYVADDGDIVVDSTEGTSEVTEDASGVAEGTEPETTTIIEENPVDESLIMTEGDTPFDELKEALNDGIQSYDIALIDTGASNVTSAYSVIGDATGDDNGHGTKMVNAICGQNQNARILSIKAADANGRADVSAIYAAFEYAISQDVKIINLSMSAIATSENAIIVDEIEKAVSLGITVVGAAGNNAANAAYFVPGKIDNAFIIGAADETGTRLSTSNYGDTVDYNVYAESTSEAAAKFSGWISLNGTSAIKDVLNRELIFTADYVKEEATTYTLDVDSTDFVISGEITFPSNITVYAWTPSAATEDILLFSDDLIPGTSVPIYCINRELHTPHHTSYSLTSTKKAEIMYCISHGVSITGKGSLFDGVSTYEAQFLTQAAIHMLTESVYGVDQGYSYYYIAYNPVDYGNGNVPSLTEYYCYAFGHEDEFGSTYPGNFKKAFELYEAAIKYGASEDTSYMAYYSPSDTNKQNIVTGYVPTKADISITKSTTADTSKYPLTGALYSIYTENNTWVGSFITGAKGTGYVAKYTEDKSKIPSTEGTIVVKYGNGWYYADDWTKTISLDPGTYQIAEKVAPSGYELNSSVQTFVVKAGETKNLTAATNSILEDELSAGSVQITKSVDTPVGTITLTKTSANTSITDGNDAYSLEGAVYGIYSDPACTQKVSEMITGASGKATSSKLALGTYYVKEISASKGYSLDTSVYTVNVRSDTTFNKAATYTVYSGSTVVGTLTCDATTGVSNTLTLANGTYTLKEASPASGYALNNGIYTFTISSSNTISLTSRDTDILNDAQSTTVNVSLNVTETPLLGSVTLKKDAAAGVDITKYPLTGALYSVYDMNNAWMGSFITGTKGTGYVAKYVESESEIPSTEGTIVVKYGNGWYYADDWTTALSLKAGTYKVLEKAAPAHYALHSDSYTFVVSPNETTSLTANESGILTDPLLDGQVQITKSVDTPVGHIDLTKTSANKTITDGNDCYSLEGAVYGIYADKDCKEKIGRMTTNAEGKATSADVEVGTYYVKEITASKGYALDTTVHTVDVRSTSTTFNKAATYTVYSGDTAVGTLICDATTGISNKLTLADGTYTLRETTPASGYALNNGIYEFDIIAGELTTLTSANTTILNDTQETQISVPLDVTETPLSDPGEVTLKKKSAEDAIYIEGAVFKVEYFDNYNTSGTATRTWYYKTDSKGTMELRYTSYLAPADEYKSDALYYSAKDKVTFPLGSIRVTEVYAPEGYILLSEPIVGTIKTSGEETHFAWVETEDTKIDADNEIEVYDAVKYGSITVTKEDIYTTTPEGDASFDGIEVTIYNNSGKSVYIPEGDKAYREVKDQEAVCTLVFEDGESSVSTGDILPLGVYTIKETATNESHLLNEEWIATATLADDGSDVLNTTYENDNNTVQNTPVKGGVKVQKINEELGTNENEGLSSLKDCVIAIVNASDAEVYVDGSVYQTISGGNPYTKDIVPSDLTREELIEKIEDAKSLGENVVVKTITTDENGVATTESDLLPYGTYYLYEVSANGSMQIDEDWVVKVEIRENRVIVDTSETPIEDPIVRGDLFFEKTNETGYGKPNIPFLLVSYDIDGNAIEAHVIVTGAEGYTDTAHYYVSDGNGIHMVDRDNTYMTNGFDSYVKYDASTGEYYVTAEGEALLESGEAAKYGIWFSQGVNPETGELTKTTAAPDNSRGALYYGNYKLFEIKCNDNTSKGENLLYSDDYIPINQKETTVDENGNIAKEISDFLVRSSKRFQNLEVELTSEALDVASSTDSKKSHVTFVRDDVQLSDTISYTHLESTTEYKWVISFVETDDPTNVLSTVTIDRYKPVKQSDTEKLNTTFGEFTISTDGSLVNADCSNEPIITTTGNIDTRELEGRSISAIVYLYEYTTGYDFENEKPSTIEVLNFIKSHNIDCSDENEVVYIPSMETMASDKNTTDHVGTNVGTTAIIDKVSMTNIGPMEYYLLVETIMDKDTGEVFAKAQQLTQTFYADRNDVNYIGSYEVDMNDLEINSEDLEGAKTLVAYEELWRVDKNGNKIDEYPVITHEDILDEDETIWYPSIFTNASDLNTGDEVGTSGKESVIIDEVTYENLLENEEYVIKGKLVYQEDFVDADGVTHKAGDVLVQNGEECTAETTLAAGEHGIGGSATLEFTIDSSVLEGATLVAFEDLYHNNVKVAAHADISDEAQTVHIPKIKTAAIDSETKDHVGSVFGTGINSIRSIFKPDTKEDQMQVIIDTVELTNLVPGKTYTINGVLMDKTTGTEILVNDEPVTRTVNITVSEDAIIADGGEIGTITRFDETHNRVDGTVTVTYSIDSASLMKYGTDDETKLDIVVFEDLVHNDTTVASHSDLTDEAQSIYNASIDTVASDKATKDHVGDTPRKAVTAEDIEDEPSSTITDIVSFDGLVIGEEYTVVGQLVLRDDTITSGQTVYLNANGHATDDALEAISAVTTFVADAEKMDISLDFEVLSENVAGKTIVVYEKLFHNNVMVTLHCDPYDEDETIYYPDVCTAAADGYTADRVGTVIADGVFYDSVECANLIAGETYAVGGMLKYESDVLDESGKIIHRKGETVEDVILTEATLGDTELEISDGKATFVAPAQTEGSTTTITLKYELNTEKLNGYSLVAMEKLYHNDVIVAIHADMDDETQTVHYSNIYTNASDISTGDDVGTTLTETTIVDVVTYENLLEDKEYVIKGKLVYQEDFVDAEGVEHKAGEALIQNGAECTAETTLAAGEHGVGGAVTLEFTIDSHVLEGATLVAYEELYHNNVKVTAHADIDDDAQTVHLPKIRTIAIDSETKDHVGTIFGSLINTIRRLFGEDIAEDQMQTIVDTVELTNLVPGKTYTINGTLMDKTTGAEILVDGEPVTKTVNITVSGNAIIADNSETGTVTMFDEAHNRVDGTITVTYSLDSASLMKYGTDDEIKLSIVVFENLIHNDVTVATHSDLTDESQSIYNASINTLATDKMTEDHVGDTPRKAVTAEDIEDELSSMITDVVSLDGLAEGEEYTVKGHLVLKEETIEAGKTMYLTAEGEATDDIEEAISSTTTFVAEAGKMDVSLDFEVSSENVAGKTVVVYERLIHNDVVITLHCDPYDEEQSIHYPNIYTNASDISTGDDVGTTLTETTILDEVTYENLLEDEEYVIRGKLVYQDDFVDVNGVEHKAGEVVVVPSYSEKTLVQEAYDEPVSRVVYTCECGSTFESRDEVEAHQSESGCTTGSWKSITEYVHHDAVYDIITTDAYECTAEAILAAGEHTTDGTVTLEFTVSGNALKGATLVAYEELYHNDVKVTTHADIDDDAQTVHFPEIYTTAVDSKTQDHVGSVFGSTINAIRRLFGEDVADDQMQVITDTVTLKNLVPGRTYTINGYLIDKSTGLAVTVNDEPVTKTVNFTVSGDSIIADNGETGTVTMFDETHNRVDGTVTITYCIDSAALMNYGTDEIHLDTVVFEFLIHNGTVVARHSDITDEAQSVYNASIKTVATDKATGNHVGDSPRSEATAKDIEDELSSTITDVVSLNGLVVGSEYTVEGQLVLKDETNEAGSTVYLNADGDATDNAEEAISATTTFVADAEKMDVTLDFEVTSEKAAGRTVVVYEKLFHNGIMITLHCNPNDKAETVWYPHIQTTAFDVNTAKRIIDDGSEISLNDMNHVGVVGTTTISDIVEYHNLIADEEYRVEGRLVYTYDVLDAEGNVIHAAGDLFCDKDGNAYTASTVLSKGHLTQGIARVNFEIDSSMLAGVTLTVEEVLINGETVVATHADINDEAQQIYFPELIRTTLSDENENKLVNATETIKLVDKVEYTNLVPGNTYKLNGVLMDKVTGKEALDDNGEKIISTVEFTPESANGTTEVVFEFSGVSLAGTSLVAFETLYYNDVIVNVHADIDDEAQTVYLPKIETTLGDAKGIKLVNASKTIKLVDTVNYENLIAEKTYKLEGVLMDKATGKEILDDNGQKITAEASFTPKETSGSAEITFEFSGVSLAGKTVVAFETLYFEESEIASHTDIDDEAQTVYIPKVGTTAAFKDGSKSAVADADNTIVDKVSYSNVVVGETYVVRGKLMSKETGNEILINGKEITAETTFVAQNANGEVTLEFIVPKGAFTGDAVVFEELYLVADKEETLIGEHKDINDAQQTVNISTLPATGDTDITPFAIIGSAALLLALIGIFILIKRKKMDNVER